MFKVITMGKWKFLPCWGVGIRGHCFFNFASNIVIASLFTLKKKRNDAVTSYIIYYFYFLYVSLDAWFVTFQDITMQLQKADGNVQLR